MLGKQKNQFNFSDMDGWFNRIPKTSVWYKLRQWADANVADEDFVHLFDDTGGRSSVPPRLTFIAFFIMLDQMFSYREMHEAAMFDDRVKFVLGLSRTPEYELTKSTLNRHHQMFMNDQVFRQYFKRSLHDAAAVGMFEGASSDIVDSFMVVGATSKRDTYTLIKKAMLFVLRQAEEDGLRSALEGMLIYREYEAKGKPKINWNDEAAKNELLGTLVQDARRISKYVRNQPVVSADLKDAVRLLELVAEQDIEEKDGEIKIAQGTAKDRIISVTDPEMRHGHKTSSYRSDGYKGNILAGGHNHSLITAITEMPANAADATALDELLEQREENTGEKVEHLLGDTAYGGAETRLMLEKQEIELTAKAPPIGSRNSLFSKQDFNVDLDEMTITCPAGASINIKRKRPNAKQHGAYRFPAETCNSCPMKDKCTQSKSGRGIQINEHEKMLQEARAEQETSEFKAVYRFRSRAERVIANITRRGARKARFYGRAKTAMQLMAVAIVHNVITVANYLASKANKIEELPATG